MGDDSPTAALQLAAHVTILGGEEDGAAALHLGSGTDRGRGANIFMTSDAEVKNLEAISRAIDQHNANCPFPASEVRMNPFEIERLGWEEIRGLPIVGDPAIGTGRFRIVCSRDSEGGELVEAIAEPIEVGAPEPRSS